MNDSVFNAHLHQTGHTAGTALQSYVVTGKQSEVLNVYLSELSKLQDGAENDIEMVLETEASTSTPKMDSTPKSKQPADSTHKMNPTPKFKQPADSTHKMNPTPKFKQPADSTHKMNPTPKFKQPADSTHKMNPTPKSKQPADSTPRLSKLDTRFPSRHNRKRRKSEDDSDYEAPEEESATDTDEDRGSEDDIDSVSTSTKSLKSSSHTASAQREAFIRSLKSFRKVKPSDELMKALELFYHVDRGLTKRHDSNNEGGRNQDDTTFNKEVHQKVKGAISDYLPQIEK